MSTLIHADLTYRVRGVLFDVYNTLGPVLKEEYYRDAIALGLDRLGIRCEAEKSFEVFYEGERVGLYYVDVWVEGGKLLLEIKVASAVEPLHKAQALSYLKVTDADLALVASFGGPSVQIERLPNFLRGKASEFVWEPQPVDPALLYPDLVNQIQRTCHRVHRALGPGFLHQVYRRAVLIELHRSGIHYEYLKQLPIEYQGHILGYQDVRLISIEDKVLLAVFALRQSEETLAERLKAHLHRLGLKLGLLANFHETRPVIEPVRVN